MTSAREWLHQKQIVEGLGYFSATPRTCHSAQAPPRGLPRAMTLFELERVTACQIPHSGRQV